MKIGIDSVEVKRIKKLFSSRTNLEKIYSKTELENIYKCANFYERASGYFAVKESFVKALGIGFNGEIALNDICVCYESNGAPKIELTEKIKNILLKYGFNNCEISITHTKDMASAICLLY